MDEIRKRGHDSETVNAIYVTDPVQRLIGVVTLRQLVLANPSDKIRGMMRAPALCISAFDDREEAQRLMERYGLPVLPVVDSGGVLVGIVTADDIIEVAQEETTEDFHKSAGVAPLRSRSKRQAVHDLQEPHRLARGDGSCLPVFERDHVQLPRRHLQAIGLVVFMPLLIDAAAMPLPVGHPHGPRLGHGRRYP